MSLAYRYPIKIYRENQNPTKDLARNIDRARIEKSTAILKTKSLTFEELPESRAYAQYRYWAISAIYRVGLSGGYGIFFEQSIVL